MGDISNMLSGGQSGGYQDLINAYQNATTGANNMYQQGMGGLQPYNQAGQSAIPQYQNVLNQIAGQENGNWMKGYQESPYAQYLTGKETNAMQNAAAAGGILGTGANQQAVANLANNITAQDMQNYFNNMQSQNAMQLGGYGNLMNQGLSAGQSQAGLSQGFGNLLAQLAVGQGQAQGNRDLASTQGKESGLGGLIGGVLNPGGDTSAGENMSGSGKDSGLGGLIGTAATGLSFGGV